MQQSVSSFSPQFGGSLQKLLSLFASSGLSSAAFSLGAGGGAGLFAAGGYIRGAGSGTSDSILARISNGEFVVNAAATSRHRSMLETINSAPRFSAGGMVGGGGYGSKTEVHVHNNNGSKVNVKHSQDGRGQPRVEISVDEQVAGALRSDRSARTMATQYGAGRRLERT